MMRSLAPGILLLAVLLCACAPVSGGDPYASRSGANATLDAADAALRATRAAQAERLQAATMEAERTADAAGYAQTQIAAQQTLDAGRYTQAAAELTIAAARITQQAEYARATEDWRVSGLEYDKRMTQTWAEANATSTAVAGLARRQKATDTASTLWKIVLPVLFFLTGVTLLLAFFRYQERRAIWVQYPAKNPLVVVNVVTGQTIPLLPSVPAKALPANVYDASRQGRLYGGQGLREQVVMKAIQLMGPRATQFPSDDKLGMSSSKQWQLLVTEWVSEGWLRTVDKQGTFCTEKCPTLGDLYHNVVRKRQNALSPTEDYVQ